MEPEKEKEMQELYVNLQLLTNAIKQLQRQIQMLEEQFMNMQVVKSSLDELAEVKVNSPILVPVADGIFCKATLQDNKELLMNIGGSIAVKKGIPDAKEYIDERLEELKKNREEMTGQLASVVEQTQKLQDKFNSLVKEE